MMTPWDVAGKEAENKSSFLIGIATVARTLAIVIAGLESAESRHRDSPMTIARVASAAGERGSSRGAPMRRRAMSLVHRAVLRISD
jgi:hypothetical protein